MNGGTKRKLAWVLSLTCLSIWLVTGVAGAGTFAYPFIGKWNNYEQPITLDQYDFQDIQNLRSDGKRLKAVRGHTAITSTPVTSYRVAGLYQFKKSTPFEESHVLLSVADDSGGAAYSVYENTTAILSTGDFSPTAVHTHTLDTASLTVRGNFSTGPQGTLVYSDGEGMVVWGGDENNPLAVLTGDDKDTTGDFDDHTEGLVTSSARSGATAYLRNGGDDTYTKLLLHMEGTEGGTSFVDSGATGHTVNSAGDAETTGAQKVFGAYSAYFDSDQDSYLDIADHSDWDFGAAAFEIDTWVRFESVTGQDCLYSQIGTSRYVALYQDHDKGTLYFYATSGTSGVRVIEGSASWTPVVNTDYHVAVIRGWGGSVNSWAITINGTAIATWTDSDSMEDANGSVYVGVLPGSIPIDFGATGHFIIGTNGASTTHTVQQFGSGSARLDGTDDIFTSPDHADWDFLDYTNAILEVWAQHDDHAGSEYYVEHFASADDYWALRHIDGTGVNFVIRDNASTVLSISGGEITDSSLHHIVLAKVGNSFGLYKDGVQIAYGSYSGSPNEAAVLTIGAHDGGASGHLAGYLDDMRLYNGNPYSADPDAGLTDTITVPTAAHTEDASTLLLVHFDTSYLNGWLDEYRVSKGVSRWTANFVAPVYSYTEANLDHVLVGSPYKLNGCNFYFNAPNTQSGTLTVYAYKENGWEQVSGVTDGTASGGSTFAQDGLVSWTYEGDEAKRVVNYLDLYWYAFDVSLVEGQQVEISRVTTRYPAQSVSNIWDGSEVPVASFIHYDASASDFIDNGYTTYLQDEDTTTTVPLDSATSSDYFLVGFAEPVKAINIRVVDGKENSTASTSATVYYRSSAGWVPVDNADGPLYDSITLSRTGITQWSEIPKGEEVKYKASYGEAADNPLYYYFIQTSGTLDAETEIYYITGIRSTSTVGDYKFSATFANRTWLFNEVSGEHNLARFSAFNSPYIYNGTDTNVFRFGSGGELTAAAPLYNVFQSTGYQQMIVTTESQTYRILDVDSAVGQFDIQTMSDTKGCTAPRSMAVCDVHPVENSPPRQVVVWVSADGVELCDGAKVERVSGDIRAYWDPNHTSYIAAATRKDAVGWYDSSINSYKLILGTLELEYSFKEKKWTKLYREDGAGANPLAAAAVVVDTNGGRYTYGVNDDVDLYRLEYGSSWNGVADIDQYVWTKELLLDEHRPLFSETVMEQFRLLYADRATSDTITIVHYCNGAASGDDPTTTNINAGPAYTTSMLTDRCLTHSFKIQCDTNATDGMELNGLGLGFTSYEVIE